MSFSDELRQAAHIGGVCDEDCLVLEAADRIEKLEAALKRIRDTEILSEWEMRQMAKEVLK